ncbi:MAG: winged helix DNA-binding domain-containing protein [Chloroflexi bacterium]|nr:winged helix DNA-binding domain-containing protein [Chloroflexota bacterium]
MPLELSLRTARRYILGRQGLWPGRRWQAPAGTDQAMRAMEHLQLDPLNMVARAHDLMLQGRVIDYRPDDWMRLVYEERRFFEWGGWLAVRPMAELPHWRVLMGREAAAPRWRAFAHEHAAAIAEMRTVLRERATVANREFTMASRTRVDSYRGRKDSAIALHYLWRIGEAMVTRRDRFERVYARADAVASAELLRPSTNRAADDFHLRKLVAASGITKFRAVSHVLARTVTAAELTRWRAARVRDGDLVEVAVEGWKGPHWVLGADRAILEDLIADRIPPAWRPLQTSTDEETTFLSPLEPVSARGRAKVLFGFDYTWEVYTPAAKRRFGYYTLPVLWRDELVGRFDSRLDRATRTLVILGFWLEDDATAGDAAFRAAIRLGATRFLGFLGATRIDATAVANPAIRRSLTVRLPRSR